MGQGVERVLSVEEARKADLSRVHGRLSEHEFAQQLGVPGSELLRKSLEEVRGRAHPWGDFFLPG